MSTSLGVVVIGRNEGQRLIRCLASIGDAHAVYVDSGSTDDSVQNARDAGAEVVELDLSLPFTAARARNAGLEALRKAVEGLEFVQFVDGDCEIVPGWPALAVEYLQQNPEVAVVCGRRRERYPERTAYNLLCDIEWDTPVGQALACGGDALYRLSVLTQVEGFDPAFIAGEEPELCCRIRALGYQIWRLDAEMTWHDADMHHARQWWQRNLRSGYAFTLNWLKHGDKPEAFCRKEVRSIVFWGSVPILGVILSLVFWSMWPILAAGLVYAAQIVRMTKSCGRIRDGFGGRAVRLYALTTMLGKIPQLVGVVQCLIKKRRGKALTLVEYK